MNRLPLVVIGLVGLLAGGAIGMAAFDGDTKTETATTVVTKENTRTKTVRRGGGGGGVKTVTRTQTVTTPGSASAAPGEPTGGPVQKVSGAKTFSGKEFKQLGTLEVKKNSVLNWTNSGPVFAVISQTQLHVSSSKKKGSVRLYKGSYPQFRVAAIGNWTLKITPR